MSKLDGGLGFRDFEAFNFALLANQSWRLISNGPALVFRVLKDRYFAHSDTMEASLGSNASFLWRSLLKGREVNKQESRWRIGNGMQVKVFGDPWLNSPPYQIESDNGQNSYLMVSELINQDTMRWDVDKLLEHLDVDTADGVMKIPLGRFLIKDRLIWNESNDGCYSVRSGYFVARKLLGREVAETNNRSNI